jgi:hypothetical protein
MTSWQDVPNGSYNRVSDLETLLKEAGFTANPWAEWCRAGSPVLIIKGSSVNGFYVAELRR